MSQPPFALSESLTVEADRLAYASALVRDYCGWHIYPSVVETAQIRDTYGGSLLLLPTMNLTALGAITVTDPTSLVPLVPAADLKWSANGLVTLANALWPVGLSTIKVTYTHGYATIPDALKAVTIAVSRRMTAQMDSVTAGAVGGVTWQYGGLLAGQAALSASFTAVEAMVLDRYRLRASP